MSRPRRNRYKRRKNEPTPQLEAAAREVLGLQERWDLVIHSVVIGPVEKDRAPTISVEFKLTPEELAGLLGGKPGVVFPEQKQKKKTPRPMGSVK